MKHKFMDPDISDTFHLVSDDAVTIVVDIKKLDESQDDEGNCIINLSEDDLLAMLNCITSHRKDKLRDKEINVFMSRTVG